MLPALSKCLTLGHSAQLHVVLAQSLPKTGRLELVCGSFSKLFPKYTDAHATVADLVSPWTQSHCHADHSNELDFANGSTVTEQMMCPAVDTACSSSLVGTHMACLSMHEGACSSATTAGRQGSPCLMHVTACDCNVLLGYTFAAYCTRACPKYALL